MLQQGAFFPEINKIIKLFQQMFSWIEILIFETPLKFPSKTDIVVNKIFTGLE